MRSIRRKRNIINLIVWLVMFFFAGEQAILAQGSYLGSWPTFKSPHRINGVESKDYNIQIPKNLAQLQSSNLVGGEEMIIHVQDAHASVGAQKRIAQILELLVGRYQLDLVAIEGSMGVVNPAIASSFPSKSVRAEVAESLLKNTQISGSEFYKILSQDRIEIFGVEEEGLYRRNVDSYQRIQENLDFVKEQILMIGRNLKELQKKLYSPRVYEFIQKKSLHQAGTITYTDYWEFLTPLVEQLGLSIQHYPNLHKLKTIQNLENDIDFEKATTQRTELIRQLEEIMSQSEVDRLRKTAKDFKVGLLTPAEFHTRLIMLARDENIPSKPFADLVLYAQYSDQFESIPLLSIFSEIALLEQDIEASLMKGRHAVELSQLSKTIEILAKFLEVKLSSEDENYFRQNEDKFEINHIIKKFDEFYSEAQITNPHPVDFNVLKKAIPSADKFYEEAKLRNKSLLQNTLDRMKKKKLKLAVLVTGGFHSEGLTELMHHNKVTHLVYMPKFDDSEGDRPYASVITQKGSYLDQDAKELAKAESIAMTLASAMKSGMDFEEARRTYINSFVQSMRRAGVVYEEDYASEEKRLEFVSTLKSGFRIDVEFFPEKDPRIISRHIDSRDLEYFVSRELMKMKKPLKTNDFNSVLKSAIPEEPMSLVMPITRPESGQDVEQILNKAFDTFSERVEKERESNLFQKIWEREWKRHYAKFLRKKGVLSTGSLSVETTDLITDLTDRIKGKVHSGSLSQEEATIATSNTSHSSGEDLHKIAGSILALSSGSRFSIVVPSSTGANVSTFTVTETPQKTMAPSRDPRLANIPRLEILNQVLSQTLYSSLGNANVIADINVDAILGYIKNLLQQEGFSESEWHKNALWVQSMLAIWLSVNYDEGVVGDKARDSVSLEHVRSVYRNLSEHLDHSVIDEDNVSNFFTTHVLGSSDIPRLNSLEASKDLENQISDYLFKNDSNLISWLVTRKVLDYKMDLLQSWGVDPVHFSKLISLNIDVLNKRKEGIVKAFGLKDKGAVVETEPGRDVGGASIVEATPIFSFGITYDHLIANSEDNLLRQLLLIAQGVNIEKRVSSVNVVILRREGDSLNISDLLSSSVLVKEYENQRRESIEKVLRIRTVSIPVSQQGFDESAQSMMEAIADSNVYTEVLKPGFTYYSVGHSLATMVHEFILAQVEGKNIATSLPRIARMTVEKRVLLKMMMEENRIDEAMLSPRAHIALAESTGGNIIVTPSAFVEQLDPLYYGLTHSPLSQGDRDKFRVVIPATEYEQTVTIGPSLSRFPEGIRSFIQVETIADPNPNRSEPMPLNLRLDLLEGLDAKIDEFNPRNSTMISSRAEIAASRMAAEDLRLLTVGVGEEGVGLVYTAALNLLAQAITGDIEPLPGANRQGRLFILRPLGSRLTDFLRKVRLSLQVRTNA